MKLGTQTASLVNHIYSTSTGQPEPQIGMGVTILCWTDRQPGTIIKVTPSQIHIQHDTYTRLDSNGMSESQEYSFSHDPHGIVTIFRKTKRGWKSPGGNGLLIGSRRKYHDFTF